MTERLKSSLRGNASEAEIGRELVALFSSYASQARSEEAQETRLIRYIQALRGYPLWALQEATRLWDRGEADGAGAFAPSPPQLALLCRRAMEPVQRLYGRVLALSQAKVDEAPTIRTEEQKARIEAMAAGALRPMVKSNHEAAE